MLTLSWLGFAIACPFVGFLSDFYERRKSVLSLCCLLNFVAIIMIVFLEKTLYLQIGFFVLGVGASGIGIGFAMVAEQFRKPFVAIGFGLVNALVMSISALNAPFIGMILDQISGQSTPVLQDYVQTFYILIGIAFAGLVISIFGVKETYCKSAVNFTFLKVK